MQLKEEIWKRQKARWRVHGTNYLNAKTKKYGSTPLHLACRDGHEKIASFLLEMGANVESKNKFGRTPSLYLASWKGHGTIVSFLLQNGAKVNVYQDEDVSTPLHEASKKGHRAIVSSLLEKGADVNVKDYYGSSPLHEACDYYGRGCCFIVARKWCRSH